MAATAEENVGRREASADLDLPEKEKEIRAKVEIRRLQTHFHHEAYKRKFFDADIWRQMQAQEKAIDDLKQEHRHVTLTLSQIYSPNSVLLENRNRMKVRSLLQTRMQNDALIKERKAQLADLAKQVVELEKKIVNQRDTTWRALEAKSHKHLQKKIELLEMRLSQVRKHFWRLLENMCGVTQRPGTLLVRTKLSGANVFVPQLLLCSPQATVRYNNIMTRNNRLREETASLQIQKAIYDNCYWKLEKSLVQQNKLLDAAIEQATEDYEQWYVALSALWAALGADGWCQCLGAKGWVPGELGTSQGFWQVWPSWEWPGTQSLVHTRGVSAALTCRMEDLGRISDIRDVRCRETIQYNIRLLERKCALHQESRLKNFFLSKCADLSVLKEQAKEREAFEAAERAKRSQKESYEVAYKRLLELSDGDIDDFLEDFLEKDRRFFILFNYAIRLNVRNEGLRQRIEAIQDDMMAISTEREQAETARTHVLQELEAKIAEITEEANKYENNCKESSKLLGQIQSRIETLLKDMDCDTTKIVKPLGDSLVPVFGRPPPWEVLSTTCLHCLWGREASGSPALQTARGGFGQGPGARTLQDTVAPSHPGPVENKIKEFLLKESLLRYTSIDRTQRAQAFVSPLRGASSLLWTMDRAKLCPPPPDLEETTDPKTGEQGEGREGPWLGSSRSPIP
ncbi:coiled-coil domain-containing protein 63 [Motacilla alba alba]|uniref:coiled-coil domain-containing protein 63 n=1 Tax=Motacilla alba alba TaxID=1094192 RepID=UPI0018D563C7|nr:coiled-coil domain-containing protein 63 [Motacilla alba alba]